MGINYFICCLKYMSLTITKHILINPEWSPVQDWGECAEFVFTGTQAEITNILGRDEHEVRFPYVPGPYLEGSCVSAGFIYDRERTFDFYDHKFVDIKVVRSYHNKEPRVPKPPYNPTNGFPQPEVTCLTKATSAIEVMKIHAAVKYSAPQAQTQDHTAGQKMKDSHNQEVSLESIDQTKIE